jgi:DNA-directed RNA polymerase specialized sigma24 family protein
MAPAMDDDTIRDASAGDSAAFSALLGPLLDPAFKLATLLLRDPAEAEDAVSSGWTRRISSPSSPSTTWTYP